MSISPVGKLLKKARKNAQLSKRQLAIRSGIEISTIIKLEHGQQKDISSQRLNRLAKALNVDLNFFG